ncbi:MAG: anti-sigma factor domain-containing protein [Clostridiaceae bacterium]|nr:anti-sigma factor domain-containing protein [Clostridiaceae bacterium]
MKHKGCIMEVRNDTMIIMAEDCNFYEIKKRSSIHEGMEIEFDLKERIQHKKYKLPSFGLVAATIIFLFITSIYGFNNWYVHSQPVALLTIDINPSVELEINNRNAIIRAIALNKEAEELELSSLKKKNVREAFDILVHKAEEKGYLINEEKNYILLTTVTLDENKINAEQLKSMVQEIKKEVEADTTRKEKTVEIVTLEASKDALKRAQKDNVSVGKLKMYEEIQEDSSVADLNTLHGLKVKELITLQNQHAAEREHPVFDQRPGNKNKSKEAEGLGKQHPVFDQHPGQKNQKDKNKDKDKESIKLEKRNDNKEIIEEKHMQHPVFDQHPANKKDKDEKQHPVFEEHPGQGRQKKY